MRNFVTGCVLVLLAACSFVFVSAAPASAASCSGGWFNAQYPVGSASVSAVGSCGSGAIGYPYASHTSPVSNICVQWFNNFDQWQSMGCTAIQTNAPPTYAVASYRAGSWRTAVTGGSGTVYSATRSL